MQINSVSNQATVLSGVAARSLENEWIGTGGNSGPLSRKEYEMVKAVTGMDFNWPPQRDELFPGLALDISIAHMEQMSTSGAMQEFTSAKMLSELHQSGKVSGDELDSMMEYLRTGKGTDATRMSVPSQMQPGTVGPDGSIYL